MTDKDFSEKLLAMFKVEAQEHVAALSSGLVELEKETSAKKREASIEVVYREAHSLKGAARSVNAREIETLCQALEGVLAALKRQEITSSPELFDLLHRAVDSLGLLLPFIGDGSTGARSPRNAEIIGLLKSAAEGAKVHLPENNELNDNDSGPQAEPLPVRQEIEPGSGAPAAAMETIRVSIAKLTPLLLQAEELVSTKLAANQRAVDIREVNSSLAEWSKQWARVYPEVRKHRHLIERKEQPDGDKKAAQRSARVLEFLDWNAAYIQALERKLQELAKYIELDQYSLDRMLNNLLESTKRVLMLPLSSLLDILPKLVRDLSRDQGKQVELVISGDDVEVDRRILEEMKDPLIHLARNCIDHGIEKPAERKRKSKPPTGLITITTVRRNSHVEITISDDGAGLAIARVREACLKRGIIGRDEMGKLNEHEVLSLIFRSGVSTSSIITDISGRGLGLAIVREKVEKLGGEITFESRPGAGTEFHIKLPLTMATFRGVVARVIERLFIFPTVHVERVIRVSTTDIKTVENRETISTGGQVVALIRLAEILGVKGQNAVVYPGDAMPAVILSAGGKRIALMVDEILGEQEVLVKSLGRQLARVQNISGAAILGNGKVVPILNPIDLVKSAASAGGAAKNSLPAETIKRKRQAVLVVEDSITARTLLKNILEGAAYDVTTAVDGVDGFTQVRSGEFDLVVSDVDMPRMNGFDLTAKIRADKKLAELPVVLVTALDSREDRERGIDVGASAYIVKSSFDQSNLLEVIRRLI
ncbi:MAG: hybrid sensor histidine kinase/response regulator [Dehalococcoidia bacterium]